jgi:hypothetical protein
MSQVILPEIDDVVAGYHYVLDPENHVAHRVASAVTQNRPMVVT